MVGKFGLNWALGSRLGDLFLDIQLKRRSYDLDNACGFGSDYVNPAL